MKTGTLISGAGHAVVIALAALGLPWLDPDTRDAIRVTDVRFITEAEFETVRAGAQPVVEVPINPDSTIASEEIERSDLALEQTASPPLQQAPPPERDLELSALSPGADPRAPLRAPDGALDNTAPTVFAPQMPERVATPRPRPAPQIIDVPSSQQVEKERIAPRGEVEVAPAPIEAEAPKGAAPEPESSPEAVLPDRVDLAMAQSLPPRARPKREPEPNFPPPQPEASDLQSTIESLVAGATAPTLPTSSAVTPASPAAGAEGAPLSAGERDGLRLAVQACWIVPAGLRDAEELRVVLGAELTVQGDVISSSVQLIEPDPIPDDRFRQAYEAGRRALIRCSPYTDLPREKFAQWRNIEVVFNPEGMVSW